MAHDHRRNPRASALAHLLGIVAFAFAVCSCGGEDGGVGPTADTQRPAVADVTPTDGTMDMNVTDAVRVTFSEDIDPISVRPGGMRLTTTDALPVPVPGTVSVGTDFVSYQPTNALEHEKFYRATIDTSVMDMAGNRLAEAHSWTFRTAAAPRAPVEIPLEEGVAWVYAESSIRQVWTRTGVSRSKFEGRRVLFAERPVSHQGRNAWLVRSFKLDDEARFESGLTTDWWYLSKDHTGLYRARPESSSPEWKNILRFGVAGFNDSAFLIAGGPAHSDGTVVSVSSTVVNSVTYPTLRVVHDFTETGRFVPADIFETRTEHYADEIGLLRASWSYSYDDNDPGGIDSTNNGSAVLTETSTPTLPGDILVVAEQEPNGFGSAQALTWRSIVSGETHIGDTGTLLNDATAGCPQPGCVAPNVLGERRIQDWYRFTITYPGQYRLDLTYETRDPNSGALNDLDLYLFRVNANGSLGFYARSTGEPTEPEWMVDTAMAAGDYAVAVQAWDTPGAAVPYALVIRLQPVPVTGTVTRSAFGTVRTARVGR